MEKIIDEIRLKLGSISDEKTLVSSQRFFKEKIKLHGVKGPIVKKLSREYFKLVKHKNKSEIFDLCESLWQSGFIEESFIACEWSYYIHKKYEPEDFEIFVNWIDHYVSNWASCDTLCNHTLGEFIEMYPNYLKELKELAKSKNRWMKRASAVSLIIPARKGKFLKDIFEIADILMMDKDDMVQKGYGWMLKAASQANLQAVFEYVYKNKAVMPRTALRYAIEKMPEELKRRAMG
jgi:3-methyladenine DNA glycosylase AlkD